MSKLIYKNSCSFYIIVVPIRLQVLKNGERDLSKVVSVVGPDISNVIRRYHIQIYHVYFSLVNS